MNVEAHGHLVDYMQTRTIIKPNNIYVEANPIYNLSPEPIWVTSAFIIFAVVHWATSYLLPEPWRDLWQAFTFGQKATTVYLNMASGVEFTLPWEK